MTRNGFALLIVLLAVVALELLTLSTLALSTHERLAAASLLRTAQARRRTDSAMHAFIRTWPHGVESLAVGGRRVISDSADVKLEVERHNWGTYQLTATTDPLTAAQPRTMLLRTLDAERAFHELNNALIMAGPFELSASGISNLDAGSCPIPFASDRPPYAITVARSEHAPPNVSAVVDSAHAQQPDGYALGGLRWAELAGIADTVVSGTIAWPSTDSTELMRYRLSYAPGDLAIEGGAGRGVLLVQGNLVMRGTQFSGVVLVGGALELSETARMTGAVRVQGQSPSVLRDALVQFAHCDVAQALLGVPAAARLVPGGRRLLPTF